jgi:hypothetical protein
MQVVIDTEKPSGKLVVDINGQGQMVAEFNLMDPYLQLDSIQLQYRTNLVTSWQNVPAQLTQGSRPFEVNGTAVWDLNLGVQQIEIRLTANDRAGNEFSAFQQPMLPRTAQGGNAMILASNRVGNGQDPSQAPRIPLVQTSPVPTPARAPAAIGQATGSTAGQAPMARGSIGDQTASSAYPSPPNTIVNPFLTAQGTQSATVNTGESVPLQIEVRPGDESIFGAKSRPRGSQPSPSRSVDIPGTGSGIQISGGPGLTLGGSHEPQPRVAGQYLKEISPEMIQTPQPVSKNSPVPEGAEPSPSPFGADIKPFHSNSKAFSLDYELEASAGTSVASVDLYGTMDRGKTWKKWGSDPDGRSPFDIKVEDEGLFGFRMVVVSSNNLVTNRPVNGDDADAWILVDTKVPQARLINARYGQGAEAGSLIIEYQANDEFLADRPITLSFSQTPEGPWTTLASGLRNTGRYAWTADPNLPRRIYLRIEAIDGAGNMGVHRLDLPVDVEGLAPRGRIQGFRPIVTPKS